MVLVSAYYSPKSKPKLYELDPETREFVFEINKVRKAMCVEGPGFVITSADIVKLHEMATHDLEMRDPEEMHPAQDAANRLLALLETVALSQADKNLRG
jgi:hypothetical protein